MALWWGAGSTFGLRDQCGISWSFSCPIVGETVRNILLMIWLHFH